MWSAQTQIDQLIMKGSGLVNGSRLHLKRARNPPKLAQIKDYYGFMAQGSGLASSGQGLIHQVC